MRPMMPTLRAVPKPPKKAKKPAKRLRGGKAPRKAGIKQEGNFRDTYDGFRRVVGSGAFGNYDPTLKGDLKGEVGRKKFLLEMKAWTVINGKGEKTITVPLSVLDKIRQEADVEIPPRHAGVIFHPMRTSRWIAIFDWDDFYNVLHEQEEYIARLEAALDGPK
jgi:hypothetical protein